MANQVILIDANSVNIAGNKYTYDTNQSRQIRPTKAEFTIQLNQASSLHVECPIDDTDITNDDPFYLWEKDNVISVKIFDNPYINRYQLFRIKSIAKTPSLVTCDCDPVFLDARGTMVCDTRIVDKNIDEALNILSSGSKFSHNFATYKGTLKEKTSVYIEWMDLMTALNGSQDNSIMNRYGGEFLLNNYEFLYSPKFDQTNTVDNRLNGYANIKAGLNMTGITYTVDTSDLITEIWPEAYNGYHLMDANGNYESVKSSRFNDYPVSHPTVVKFDNIKLKADASTDEDDTVTVCETLSELYDELRKASREKFNNEKIDIPTITYDIDFLDLEQTREYEGYEQLIHMDIGDTVYVYNEDMKISTYPRIKGVTYDCINGIVTKMTLGDYKDSYTDRAVTTSTMTSAIYNQGANGTNASSLVGVSDGTKTQIQVKKDTDNKGDIITIKFEDTDKSSETYGAVGIGTKGIMCTRAVDKNGNWDWSSAVVLNSKGIFFGKLGDSTGSKYIQMLSSGLRTVNGSATGVGFTGEANVSAIKTVNGIVVGVG